MEDIDITMIIRTCGCVFVKRQREVREYVVYFVTTHEYTNTMGGQVSA